MKQFLAIAVAAGVFTVAGSAADEAKKKKKEAPPADPEVLFKKLDVAGQSQADDKPDGKLSLAEFKSLAELLPKPKGKKAADATPPDLEKAFKLLDKNGDGFLSPDEFKNVGTLVPLTAPQKKK